MDNKTAYNYVRGDIVAYDRYRDPLLGFRTIRYDFAYGVTYGSRGDQERRQEQIPPRRTEAGDPHMVGCVRPKVECGLVVALGLQHMIELAFNDG